MPSSNYCFLTCMQVSQETGKVICSSNFLKNCPQFVVVHTVEGFCIVNEAEVDVFLEISGFFEDPADVGNLISGVKTPSTSTVSESTIWQENEKQDTRIQWKARIRGPTPLQGEGAETEFKPALLMKEYVGS